MPEKIENVSYITEFDSKYQKAMEMTYTLDATPRVAEFNQKMGSVAILLYHTQLSKFLLVRQFRPAVFTSLVANLPENHDKEYSEIQWSDYSPELGYTTIMAEIDVDYGENSPRYNNHEEHGFNAAYESKEVLGRGLASTVRRCIEKGSGIHFAVKIVDVSTEKQNENEAKHLLEETISEVEILRQLSGHPSVIKIHDFYQTPSFLFAVFEMAPRGELFDQLNATVTVSEKKARRLMKQLFDGVEYMHARNIVHRDLKLENILCIDEERIVISDFGFATRLEPGRKLRDLCGTPGYLAPETIRCQMYDKAEGYSFEVDEWALGVIMYTLLAGYAPFYHRKQLMMLRIIQQGKYEFRSDQWTNITSEAKSLISRLLSVDVTLRITAKECLVDAWMIPVGVKPNVEIALTSEDGERAKKRFKTAIIWVRFFQRLAKYKYLKTVVDRDVLRKRPFRDRDIRHEAEASMFSVYGHWVNRGFYYSRDMLFANKPRPKVAKLEAATKAKPSELVVQRRKT
uniref:phosphorylase kinase n=2 Tax=Caenorhabditis japonica TaxID=281687 RepID=A0A8R1E2J9_CAEJA